MSHRSDNMTPGASGVEETRPKRIKAMGEELGTIFDAVWQRVVWLGVEIEEFTELYGKKKSRVDLANEAASRFFYIVQTVLFRDIVLCIARMTDRKKVSGKNNLTILRFPDIVIDPALKSEIEIRIDKIIELSMFAREWRNRKIAHNDLDLSVNAAETIEPATLFKINSSVSAICDLLDLISLHYEGSSTYWGAQGSARGSVALLNVIAEGLHYQNIRIDRQTSVADKMKMYRPEDV